MSIADTTATPDGDARPPRDPDVDGLVPPARRGSGLVVAALVVAVLLAGWASTALRPTVVDRGGASGAARQVDDGQVLVGVALARGGAGPVTVASVADVPGAHVLGAWVAPAGGPPGTDMAPDGLFTVDGPVPVPGLPVGAAPAVPAPVPAGTDSWLVILWEVTDCAAVQSLGVDGPQVRLGTVLGPVTETLPAIAAPGLGADCDAGS
ncbi:hypothetical protein [Cellulomonas fimi]|uniref:hypothetical protein n=1 Tax=Cellulomonas fimi TaxID=1708 RepID=UPI002358EBB5|nr:hypothetical protein [Cellulomonas fimi]